MESAVLRPEADMPPRWNCAPEVLPEVAPTRIAINLAIAAEMRRAREAGMWRELPRLLGVAQ